MVQMEKTKLFPEIFDEKRRDIILHHPAYEAFRKDLADAYKKSCEADIKPLCYDLFRIFRENGSRIEYEKDYFLRRMVLNSCFLTHLLYGDDDSLRRLENIIMLICDEYTWALPAHVNDLDDSESVGTFIDLFAAETGQALSEVYYVLGDKLCERVASRIRHEVDRRIIRSFVNTRFDFEQADNNWAAVCGGSVGIAFIYMAPEKVPLIRERLRTCFKCYLAPFGNDGACVEGCAYWFYGFGYYLCFDELYHDFTGEYLIEPDEKIKNIAMFFQKVHISGSTVVNFADCDEHEMVICGMLYKLRERYGDAIELPDSYAMPIGDSSCYRFAICVRSFFWSRLEEDTAGGERRESVVFLPDAQWYIKKNKKFLFAAKGGNNGESHNHNDLGGFLVSDYQSQLIADLGCGEYTKQYFMPEKRYSYLCCSSLGHSVPIIDGKPQQAGLEFTAKILHYDDNSFELDLSGAYESEARIIRRFDIDEDGVTLTDSVSGAKSWTQRLISKIKPEPAEGGVRVGKMLIKSDAAVKISEDSMATHSFEHEVIPVYFIDFEPTGGENAIRLEF